MTDVSASAGSTLIRGSAFITSAEARSRGWIEIRGEAGAEEGQAPQFAVPLSGFLRVVKGPPFDDVLRGSAGGLRPPAPKETASADDPVDVRRIGTADPGQYLAEDMARIEAMLGQMLRENGVDAGIPVKLSLNREARVIVDESHPMARTIQELLDARPGLSGDLARVMGQNDRLAHFRLMQAGVTEAREDDGAVSLQEWDALTEEARAVTGLRRQLVMAGGHLQSPIQAEADRLLGLA